MAASRSLVRRASIRILGLYNLPTRSESRPKIVGGAGELSMPHAEALQYVPELNGLRVPPEAGGAPMNPAVQVSLHTIGGFCCVSPTNPPPEEARTSMMTAPAVANGLNPTYDTVIHTFSTEPRETVLKLAVLDNDQEVAYETIVVDLLRPGYRCVQLRTQHTGTKIRLCNLFVHIDLKSEANDMAQVWQLRERLREQRVIIAAHEKTIAEQARTIQRLQKRQRHSATSPSGHLIEHSGEGGGDRATSPPPPQRTISRSLRRSVSVSSRAGSSQTHAAQAAAAPPCALPTVKAPDPRYLARLKSRVIARSASMPPAARGDPGLE